MDLRKEDPDEAPILSSATLDALKEFYADRDVHEKLFEDLKSASKDEASRESLTMDAFAENWNESQFWYSQETATILANQLLANTSNETTIAVISAPSVFVQLKNLLATGMKTPKIYLLEFDERFAVFPEFVHYDFRDPFRLPSSMKGSIDHIICDPPFLSEDCQTKGFHDPGDCPYLSFCHKANQNVSAALTVRWLSRSWGPKSHIISSTLTKVPRLIICTGERMESLVTKLYRPQGVATTSFMPVHAKGLSNEFFCFANFQCDHWVWRGSKSC